MDQLHPCRHHWLVVHYGHWVWGGAGTVPATRLSQLGTRGQCYWMDKATFAKECIFSSLFAINFFISIWLCVNSKSFSDSRTAYSLAAVTKGHQFALMMWFLPFRPSAWPTLCKAQWTCFSTCAFGLRSSGRQCMWLTPKEWATPPMEGHEEANGMATFEWEK